MDSESATLRRAAKQPQIIFSPVMCQNSSHLENPLLSASGGAQNSTALNSRGELQLTPPPPAAIFVSANQRLLFAAAQSFFSPSVKRRLVSER